MAIALPVCLNMLSDTDIACVAIALAVCLNMLSDTDVACVTTTLAECLNMLILIMLVWPLL